MLAIFGVMPLCLVLEKKKKGTVCRAGLHRRVQSKCFVAELLSGEQKVAHIVVVSFPLHQIEIFFFLFLGGRACSSWTHAGGWNETSAAARKEKDNPMLCFSPRHVQNTSGIRHYDTWCFVVSDKQSWTVYCPHPSFPTVVFKAFSALKGSWEALTEWAKDIVRCTVHDQPAMSTQALILWAVSIFITSLRRLELPVNEGRYWCRDRRANLSLIWDTGGVTQILYLTPHMVQLVWKTVLINWLHWGIKGAPRLFWWSFSLNRKEAVFCCLNWLLLRNQVKHSIRVRHI